MGQSLYDALVGRNLVLYADNELRQHALSTVGVEGVRGWRIAKEKASKKIDVIIALSLACVSAMEHRGEIGSRSARGFNRAVHVASRFATPYSSGRRCSHLQLSSLKVIMAALPCWRPSRARQ